MKLAVVATLTGLLALAVGIGVGYAVGAGGSPGEGERAEVWADLACDGAVTLPADLEDDTSGLPAAQAVGGVGSLAMGAGEDDAAYEDLGEAGEQLFRTVQLFDVEGYPSALDDLTAACEER